MAAVCVLSVSILAASLESQKAAKRWRGENALEFTQLTCYLPVAEKIGLNEVYAFRESVDKKLHEAALDIGNDDRLFLDAWSTSGKLDVSSDRGSGEASVIAVGGEFFSFHPIRLLSGSYISEKDLMQDRVLLDEELAWLLFGGTELEGLSLRVNGKPFMVAGVIEREDDFASELAYNSGMGLFMSYDAYSELLGGGIDCYEMVLPEPVKGFGEGVVRESFKTGREEIVENSTRFGFGGLIDLIGSYGSRSMQTKGIIYPYWENAARCIEDWCALLMTLAMICAAIPAITALVWLIRLIRMGKRGLEEKVLPAVKDSAEEAIRVRQRRRWEKKRGLHEKR